MHTDCAEFAGDSARLWMLTALVQVRRKISDEEPNKENMEPYHLPTPCWGTTGESVGGALKRRRRNENNTKNPENALVQATREMSNEANKENAKHYLPTPCWGASGEFVCRNPIPLGKRAVTKLVGHSLHPLAWRRPPLGRSEFGEFIPVALLGSKWERYQVSVPRWLIQGVRHGKIRRLIYDENEVDSIEVGPESDTRGMSYEVLRASYVWATEIFDEIRLQRVASKKRRSEQGKNTSSPLMGLVDCLALWMHPAMFPRVEELQIICYWEMKCPSAMYEGMEDEDGYDVHWTCWKDYAFRILNPLLRMNENAPCGLKKLRLEGWAAKLFPRLFAELGIQTPPHLEWFASSWGEKAMPWCQRQTTHLDFDWYDDPDSPLRDGFFREGSLPNLHTLGIPADYKAFPADELIASGLCPKLRRLTSHEWVPHAEPREHPQRADLEWDLPYLHFDKTNSHIPVPEDSSFIAARFDPPLGDNLIVLPRSVRKIVIMMNHQLLGIKNIRFTASPKLEKVILKYPDGASVDEVGAVFSHFEKQAPKELLNAAKIILTNVPRSPFRFRFDHSPPFPSHHDKFEDS